MHDLAPFGTLIAIVLMGVAQFVGRRMSREARLQRERLAAAAPIPPKSRSAAPAAPPAAARRPTPAARPPQRAATAPAAPAPVPGWRAGGPRWAANAFIAAEVFGAPVADRPARSAEPGGTLGPPNAF